MFNSTNDISSDEEKRVEKINSQVYEDVMKGKDVDKKAFASYWLEDEQNVDEWTPEEINSDVNKQFINACMKGDLEQVKSILTNHPNAIKEKDADGYTGLHRACSEDKFDVAKFLLESGADKSSLTQEHWTPLHCACFWNNAEIAHLLAYRFGADVNAQTVGGLTPLHLAASQPECREVILLLLNHPFTKTNIETKAGDLAVDLARRKCRFNKLFDMTDDCLKP